MLADLVRSIWPSPRVTIFVSVMTGVLVDSEVEDEIETVAPFRTVDAHTVLSERARVVGWLL